MEVLLLLELIIMMEMAISQAMFACMNTSMIHGKKLVKILVASLLRMNLDRPLRCQMMEL